MGSKSVSILLLVAIATGASADLQQSDVSDGSCLSPSEMSQYLHKGVNPTPLLVPNAFYMPMASKAAYRNYAEALLGRLATDQAELDQMNVILYCGPLCSTNHNVGFPNYAGPPQFDQICAALGTPSLTQIGTLNDMQGACIGLPGTRPNGTVYTEPSDLYTKIDDALIWANADTSVLLVARCLPNNTKDWKVISKTKSLSAADIATISAKVVAMGFSQDNISFLPYNS